MVCDPGLLAVYTVEFILKGWHFAAQLAFPPAYMGLPGLWLFPLSFCQTGWSRFPFQEHTL